MKRNENGRSIGVHGRDGTPRGLSVRAGDIVGDFDLLPNDGLNFYGKRDPISTRRGEPVPGTRSRIRNPDQGRR